MALILTFLHHWENISVLLIFSNSENMYQINRDSVSDSGKGN